MIIRTGSNVKTSSTSPKIVIYHIYKIKIARPIDIYNCFTEPEPARFGSTNQ